MPQTDKGRGGGEGKQKKRPTTCYSRSVLSLFPRNWGRERDVIRKLDDLFLPRKKERRRDSEIDTQKKDASKREGEKEENRRRLLNSTGFFMEQSVWKILSNWMDLQFGRPHNNVLTKLCGIGLLRTRIAVYFRAPHNPFSHEPLIRRISRSRTHIHPRHGTFQLYRGMRGEKKK